MYVGAPFLTEIFSGLEVRILYTYRCQNGWKTLEAGDLGLYRSKLGMSLSGRGNARGRYYYAGAGGGGECKTRPVLI